MHVPVRLQAWIFAALNSDSPAGYYALAALYAVPWLKEGLRLDGFTLFALLACAAHVQVCQFPALTQAHALCVEPQEGQHGLEYR
jgi:hypothetical protein